MDVLGGFQKRFGLAMAGKGPWGGKAGGKGKRADDVPAGDEPSGEDQPRGPRNPWLPPEDGERRSANIEDIFRNRGSDGPRRRGGGGGPGFRLPDRPGGKSWVPLALLLAASVWVLATSAHLVGAKEQGIVTWLGGKYSRTLQPGFNATLPWPIQEVDIEPTSEFRLLAIPGDANQRLMLTGDQNLVDLSYIVRWNIKDLKQFRFQLTDPEETVEEVAEAAMRASVAEESLDRVLSGAGRATIEASVLERMQSILDAYKSGIAIQGVQIRKTDPPAEVEEAFKNVSAAQQKAESYINQAEATAQQILARAQGDATAFDKVYEQYRLAPEVTRRRMYYETMERVLRNTDKTVVESEGVVPYLPLPEMKRQQAKPAEGQ